MITYIDAKNALKYQILFNKATLALQEHPSEAIPEAERDTLSISTLADYYAYLPYLMSFPLKEDKGENEDIHYYFAKVPLDEDYFKIDANSRTIKVPALFAKNGVGVQGDEIAEVVYFAIDRYFDSIDLASVKNIIIQWQTRNGQGISQHFGKSIETVDNKELVVFGWPISSTLTAAAGTIKFAVRFYDVDENTNTIQYSFSTLPAEVAINATLNYDLFNEDIREDSHADLITSRIKSAGVYNPELPTPKVPNIITPLHVLDMDPSIRIVDLPIGGDSLKLAIGAQPTDIGVIGYKWKKFAYADGNYSPTASNYTGDTSIDYYPATELVEDKLYYTLEQNDGGVITASIVEDTSNLVFDENEGAYKTPGGSLVYEKLSVANVNSVGIYTVDVTARNKTNTTEKIMAAADGIKIPGPETPVVKFAEDELVTEESATAHIISNNGESTVLKVAAHAGEFDDNGVVKENMGDAPIVDLNYVWKEVTESGAVVPVEGAVPGEITLSPLSVEKTPNDVNLDKARNNQSKVSFVQDGNDVIVYADPAELQGYTSTDAHQAELGDVKWIGIDIDTHQESIVGMAWGTSGYTLTEDDAAEAIGLGLGAGHIIFWTYLEALEGTGKDIKVGDFELHIVAGGRAPQAVEYAFNADKSEMTVIGLEAQNLDRSYFAEVTATRNGISTTEASGTYRITNAPQEPVIKVKTANGWSELNYKSDNNVVLQSKIYRGEPAKLGFRLNDVKSDKLSYIWMRMKLDEHDVDEETGIQQLAIDIDENLQTLFPNNAYIGDMDIPLTDDGSFKLAEMPEILGEPVEDEPNAPTYQLPVDSAENPVAGYYYCIVINELNGHLAANATPFFNVQ